MEKVSLGEVMEFELSWRDEANGYQLGGKIELNCVGGKYSHGLASSTGSSLKGLSNGTGEVSFKMRDPEILTWQWRNYEVVLLTWLTSRSERS